MSMDRLRVNLEDVIARRRRDIDLAIAYCKVFNGYNMTICAENLFDQQEGLRRYTLEEIEEWLKDPVVNDWL